MKKGYVQSDLEQPFGRNNANKNDQPEMKGQLTGFTIFCLLITAIGCPFNFGWNIGVYNTPGDVIKDFYNTTFHEQHKNDSYMSDDTWTSLWSITNGLLPAGGIIGGVFGAVIADSFGRKKSMLIVNLLVFLSGILNVISKPVKSYIPIIISRFIAGLFCGFFSGIAPLYLSELPPHNWRGFSGVIFQLFITIGLLVTNVCGLPDLLGTDKLWPYLVALTIIPAALHVACAPLFVESPKYLYLNRGDSDAARAVLKKLRGAKNEEYIDYEMEQMSNERANQTEQVSYKDLFTKKTLYRPLLITVMIQMSQQFSGINAVVFYSSNIFKTVGIEGNWALYATTFLSLVQVIMTFVSMIIIDRLGRRLLLLIGLVGMAFFSFLLAITALLSDKVDWLKYISVAATVFYIVLFSIGPGPIPWLITAELFNSSARGKAASVAVFVNWTSNVIVTVTFPLIDKAIGNYSFIIFGSLLVLFVFFTFFKVPETKNKTTDEIQALFED